MTLRKSNITRRFQSVVCAVASVQTANVSFFVHNCLLAGQTVLVVYVGGKIWQVNILYINRGDFRIKSERMWCPFTNTLILSERVAPFMA